MTNFGTPVVPEVSNTHSVVPIPYDLDRVASDLAWIDRKMLRIGKANLAKGCFPNDSIHIGICHNRREIVCLQVRWTKHYSTRNSIEFDERQGRRELAIGKDQNRTAIKLGNSAAKAAAIAKLAYI